ncbi:MAG: DUF951 domain-containing protein [Ruminococcaceae bacterium]|nr:DUF951 domain-containing protein [Oscillospiraceae bacterium]MBQ1258967.1 DUF951 domain-containing protein [Clostridia bacterium]
MDTPKFNCGDTAILKKPHPCSSYSFLILRVGSDVRIKCRTCGHELTVDRIKFERMIKKIESAEDTAK